MKVKNYYIYLFIIFTAFLSFSSCHNEDILIEDHKEHKVDVTINLTDFFSCYDFVDTKHHLDLENNRRFKSLKASDICKSLCSFYDPYNSVYNHYVKIQTTVLFYNKEDGRFVKADTILVDDNTLKEVKVTERLNTGSYTAIAVLTFKVDGDFHWTLKEKESLNTVYLENSNCGAIWSIMSCASTEIVVGEKKENKCQMTPSPVGALCYSFFQNFNENDWIVDIRVYTTNDHVVGYRLNPSAPDKYVYSNNSGSFNGELIRLVPSSFFDYEATYFQGDFFDYFYILAPQCNIRYTYYNKGDKKWWPVDMPTCDIESGKTYLAYWDYNHVDKPYFGKADNDHWY